MPLQMLSQQSGANGADAWVIAVTRDSHPHLALGQSELGAQATPKKKHCVIIHTLPPDWHGGTLGEEQQLRECYRSLLVQATKCKCKTIAVPVLGLAQGVFPKTLALRIAGEEIYSFLEDNSPIEIDVRLILPMRKAQENTQCVTSSLSLGLSAENIGNVVQPNSDVDDFMRRIRDNQENFHDMLFRLIWDGETSDLVRKKREVAVYRSIYMSRQQFGKLRLPDYTPSKETVLWLAVALKLSAEETHELLNTVGYTFCRWRDFDLIVLYFISKGVYDILLINEMLCAYGQKTFLLG